MTAEMLGETPAAQKKGAIAGALFADDRDGLRAAVFVLPPER
jgi:hypothetical protein